MTTMPLLTALHTAFHGSAPLRRDVRDATQFMRQRTGRAERATHVHLNHAWEVDAIGFGDGQAVQWCGLTRHWPTAIQTYTLPAQRLVHQGPHRYEHWTRDDLLTALSERPHSSDPIHQQLRQALARHPNVVFHPHASPAQPAALIRKTNFTPTQPLT